RGAVRRGQQGRGRRGVAGVGARAHPAASRINLGRLLGDGVEGSLEDLALSACLPSMLGRLDSSPCPHLGSARHRGARKGGDAMRRVMRVATIPTALCMLLLVVIAGPRGGRFQATNGG